MRGGVHKGCNAMPVIDWLAGNYDRARGWAAASVCPDRYIEAEDIVGDVAVHDGSCELPEHPAAFVATLVRRRAVDAVRRRFGRNGNHTYRSLVDAVASPPVPNAADVENVIRLGLIECNRLARGVGVLTVAGDMKIADAAKLLGITYNAAHCHRVIATRAVREHIRKVV